MIAHLILVIVVGLFAAAIIAGVATLAAVLLSKILNRLFGRLPSELIVHVSAAAIPIWILVDYIAGSFNTPDPLASGPKVQAEAGAVILLLIALFIAWPLGYFAARRAIERMEE